MSAAALKLDKLLFEQIPLTRAMQLQIIHVDQEGCEVLAPLNPNQNHLGTAFGGSINAVLILSGYVWLYYILAMCGHDCHVILKRTEADYIHPVTKELRAICQAPSSTKLKKFIKAVDQKGLARISLNCKMIEGERILSQFTGEFVARIIKS
jgi:thioesterase domain-containing protein